MKKTLKYCKQVGRDKGYYFKNGKKHFLPGRYNSVESLIAFHRAMIDYRIEIEKLVNQVAQDQLDDFVLACQHAADKIDLEVKQQRAQLSRIGETKKPTSPPAVVLIGGDESFTIEGNTGELVDAMREGCNETGLIAILSKIANGENSGIALQKTNKYDPITVKQLYDQYWDWIPGNFPNEKQTKDDYRKSCKDLLKLYGDMLAEKFGKKELIAVQDHLVGRGLKISTCNEYVIRMRRIFNWGSEKAIIDHAIADELEWVKLLEEGRTTAPPPEVREDVPIEVVKATLKFLPQMLQDMVTLQIEAAMRPSEIFNMKWGDIDTSDDVWIYEPSEYKEKRHVDYKPIGLTSICKEILQRYKDTPPNAIIFSQVRNANEMGKSTKRFKSEMFDRKKYLDFIKEATQKAGQPHWTPYQLRHRGATDIAEDTGEEVAQFTLGHTDKKTTKRYVHKKKERVKEKAKEVIRQREAVKN
jgi:integrase